MNAHVDAVQLNNLMQMGNSNTLEEKQENSTTETAEQRRNRKKQEAQNKWEQYQKEKYGHIKKKVGVAVIGVGQRLTSLLVYLIEYHGGLVNLVAVCDDSKDALKECKQNLAYLPGMSSIKEYTDYKEMLEKEKEIEWVLIGSKNCLHRDHCVDSFKAGKHVFCEKPLAITMSQCEEIRKAHLESGKVFATGFVLRYADFYKKIKELLDSGDFGKVVSIEANELLSPDHGGYIMRNWRRFKSEAGSHLLEKCCHDIDIINWLIGSMPSRVASFGGLNSWIPENKPNDSDTVDWVNAWPAWEKVDPYDSEKTIDDNQVVIIEYQNKARVTFHTNSCTVLPQRKIIICCTKGTIEGNLLTGKLKCRRLTVRKYEEIQTSSSGIHGSADDILVNNLAKCMEKEGEVPEVTGEDGFVSAITCLCIDRAREEGIVVDLNPIWNKFYGDNSKSEQSNTLKSESLHE